MAHYRKASKIIFKEFSQKTYEHLLGTVSQVPKEFIQLLAIREIKDIEAARKFLKPSFEQLHNPFLMKGMEKTVKRILEGIEKKEKIFLIGDYDVDGTTSTAIFYDFLLFLGANVSFHIPDRHTEGYGVSELAVQKAINEKKDLIISLDCGISSVEKVKIARENNIDFIICDHHIPPEVLPDAYSILDPKQKGCKYPFKELSACGVVFKLIQAMTEKVGLKQETYTQYLDLLALSIACDIVDMTGENRVLAYFGLRKINRKPCVGVQALKTVCNLQRNYTLSDLVFTLGPRINALGRLKNATKCVLMLASKQKEEAKFLAEELNKTNILRREMDKEYSKRAIEEISQQTFSEKEPIVYYNATINKGIIGIIASRITETFYRPAIVLCENGEGILSGSGRSIEGVDLFSHISDGKDFLLGFGGHTAAAGLTVKKENSTQFKNAFQKSVISKADKEAFTPKIFIDCEISLEKISHEFNSLISKLGPFGPKNRRPTFFSRNVFVLEAPKVIKNEHLKLYVYQDSPSSYFETIYFSCEESLKTLKRGDEIDIAYKIEKNRYLGLGNILLQIEYIRRS